MVFILHVGALGAQVTEPVRVPVRIELEEKIGAIAFQVQVERAGRVEIDERVAAGTVKLSLEPGVVWIRVAGVNKFGKVDHWSVWREMRVGLLPAPTLQSASIEPAGSILVQGKEFRPEATFQLMHEGKPVEARWERVDPSTMRVFPASSLRPGEYDVAVLNEEAGMTVPRKISLTIAGDRALGPGQKPGGKPGEKPGPDIAQPATGLPSYAYLVPGLPSYYQEQPTQAALWAGSFGGLLALAAYAEYGRSQTLVQYYGDPWIQAATKPVYGLALARMGSKDSLPFVYWMQSSQRARYAARYERYQLTTLLALPAAMAVFGWHARTFHGLETTVGFVPGGGKGQWVGAISMTF